MTLYEPIDYAFTTNVQDNYSEYNPNTSPDGVYVGNGSELTPDTRKLYHCSRDYSIQEKYKVNEHGHFFLKKDDIIYREKQWYRVKQDMDISMRMDGNYGGATTLHYHDKSTHIQRTDRKIYTKESGASGDTNTESSGETGYSYIQNGVPHTVEEHYIERSVKYGQLVEEKVIYLVVPDGSSEKWIETYRGKIRTIAGYPTKVINSNYDIGEEFLVKGCAETAPDVCNEHYFTREIVSNSSLPSYSDTNYFEPLPMFTNICVEYDWKPSYRIISDDGKLYNVVAQDGNTWYEIVADDAVEAVFLGNVISDKVVVTVNEKEYIIDNIQGNEDVKFIKFNAKSNRFKVEVFGEKTGIGMILCGNGEVIGRTNEDYTIHPHDTSIYKENKGGFIEYIEGIFVYDYESTIYEKLENRAIVLDLIKRFKRKLVGVDFDEGNDERYSKTIGRLIVRDIIEKKDNERLKDDYGLEVPFSVRSTT